MIQDIVKKYLECFKEVKKDDKTIWAFSNEAFTSEYKPYYEKMSKVIHDFKGDEDTAYKQVVSCLQRLKLNVKDEDDLKEFESEFDHYVENEVDVYTDDLTEWLHRSSHNVYYLTGALKEYGEKDGFKAIALAQFLAYREIWEAVIKVIKAELKGGEK